MSCQRRLRYLFLMYGTNVYGLSVHLFRVAFQKAGYCFCFFRCILCGYGL